MTAALGALSAVFAAALGYGTLVPLVPAYLAAAGGGDVAWHSGALPAAFLAAAAVAAPLWGHLSDRIGRRAVIASGCGGALLAVVPFFLDHGLARLYVFQLVAGISFGAVAPAALALLYESGEAASRARRVAWFGVALLGGYLAGPAAGGWLAGLVEGGAGLAAHQVVRLALGAQALASAAAMAAVWLGRTRVFSSEEPRAEAGAALASLIAATVASLALGGFEIGATLHLRGPLGFDSREVAALFIVCSAAMALSQLGLLRRIPSSASRVAWALALVAAGAAMLALMGFASSYAATLALGAAIGGGLGLALGLLGLEMAAAGGSRRGLALGLQNSAVSAGQAAGSMLGGALFASLGERALPGLGLGLLLLALSLAILTQINRRTPRRGTI